MHRNKKTKTNITLYNTLLVLLGLIYYNQYKNNTVKYHNKPIKCCIKCVVETFKATAIIYSCLKINFLVIFITKTPGPSCKSSKTLQVVSVVFDSMLCEAADIVYLFQEGKSGKLMGEYAGSAERSV